VAAGPGPSWIPSPVAVPPGVAAVLKVSSHGGGSGFAAAVCQPGIMFVIQGSCVDGEGVGQPHTPHPRARCVTAADMGGHLWYQFRDPRGAARKVLSQPRQIRYGVLELPAEVDSVGGLGKDVLQVGYAPNAAWDGDNHAAQLSHQLVEVAFGARLPRSRELIQDLEEACGSPGRELNRASDSINEPAEHDLDCF